MGDLREIKIEESRAPTSDGGASECRHHVSQDQYLTHRKSSRKNEIIEDYEKGLAIKETAN